MKLKTRLAVAFMTITLVPILLIYMVVMGLSNYQAKAFSKAYGLTETIDLFSGNSVQAFNRLTLRYQEKLTEELSANSAEFEDLNYLEQLNSELERYYAYLIVRKGTDILYSGDAENGEDAEVIQQLPQYGSAEEMEEGGLYLDGDSQHLIKQMDFLYPDGAEGSVFLVSKVDDLLPEVKTMIQEMLISGIMILVIAG